MNNNQKIILDWFTAYNQKDIESLIDQCSDNLKVTTALLRKLNKHEFKEDLFNEKKGFPDGHQDVLNIISEENLVMVECVWSGTHKGEYLGRKPSNEKYSAPGAWVFQLEDGLIVQIRYYFNPNLYNL
jgi:steroid delta-isomerase-like uncharacterized protein